MRLLCFKACRSSSELLKQLVGELLLYHRGAKRMIMPAAFYRARRSRSRSRSRDRGGNGANRDDSRDRGRRRDGEDRERERDRSRGRRDRDAPRDRDRGRGDSRDRNRGNDVGRDRGSRDRARGRDRDSFDNSRDRARQGGQGQGRYSSCRAAIVCLVCMVALVFKTSYKASLTWCTCFEWMSCQVLLLPLWPCFFSLVGATVVLLRPWTAAERAEGILSGEEVRHHIRTVAHG